MCTKQKMCFWIFSRRTSHIAPVPVQVTPVPVPVSDGVPNDIKTVAAIMNNYMDPKEVSQQVDAIRDFYAGKMSYAEMRMRAG